MNNKDTQFDIKKLIDLPAYGIIANGRAGSDFLQSLFDGHPEVLTFNGFFLFYEFWNNSFTVRRKQICIEDFLIEFVGKFLHRLKTQYDFDEKKDSLGQSESESIEVDIDKFKRCALSILRSCEFNSKNALIALTASYHYALGRDLQKLKVFLHHPHIEVECKYFVEDFPNSILIFMTRDPRANIYSSIVNFSRYYPTKAGMPLIYTYYQQILKDVSRFKYFKNKIYSVRIEHLNNKETLVSLCEALRIDFQPCLLESTWGGLTWHGDRISSSNRKINTSRDVLNNGWERFLPFFEIIALNFMTRAYRNIYGYKKQQFHSIWNILLIVTIFFPTKLEREHLMPKRLVNNGIRNFVLSIYYYIKRILLFIETCIRSGQKLPDKIF